MMTEISPPSAPAGPPPGYDRLIRILAPGGRLARVQTLSGGISAGMTAVEVAAPDGEWHRWVVRRPNAAALKHNPQAAAQEYRLLQALHAQGLRVPAPVYLDEPGAVFDAPCLVLEYIDGAPDFAPVDRSAFARRLAGQLAQIHAARGDFSFLPALPADLVALCGPRPTIPNADMDEERIRSALEAAGPPPATLAAGLLHGDYWPGNVLWHGGELAGVIDWEDAFVGDPLFDLAGARMELAWIMGTDVMEAFTQEYRMLTGVDTTALPHWELRAALRLIRWAGGDLPGVAAFFVPYGRADITADSIRAQFRAFIGQALAAVDWKRT